MSGIRDNGRWRNRHKETSITLKRHRGYTCYIFDGAEFLLRLPDILSRGLKHSGDDMPSKLIRESLATWQAHADTLRDRLTRNTLKRKWRLNWWLIYGPPRTGTSYLTRLITGCSYLYISDWGLSAILNPLPDHRYIRFDSAQFTRDVSNNILDNAHRGGGNQIDLVYKLAGLGLQEYAMLVRMWGRPARIVFCLREPSAYIASARRHFASFPLAELQQCYIRALDTYDSIKGDIFEYDPGLDLAAYIEFLHPLELHEHSAEPFSPNGAQLPDAVTPEMWSAYSDFKHRHMGSGLMRHHADTT